MGKIIDKAFVLRRVRYGEQACLLELYTKHYGRLTAGSRLGKKSGKSALNNPFTFAEFDLRKRADRYYVDGGTIIEAFSGLQEDVERLTAASLLAELVLDNVREGLSDQGIYELLAYSFYALSRSSNPRLDASIAALRLLSELGFKPWLEDCVVCHQPLEDRLDFSFARGGLLCLDSNCRGLSYGSSYFSLNQSLRLICQEICAAPLQRIFNLQITAKDSKILGEFVDRYLQELFGKSYRKDSLLSEFERFTEAAHEALAGRAKKELE
ncbi:MAG: DNA repair protein RecO [Eubacteriales bacterium]|nr:DNA repair protein RecO [Eubacteriales bacterium]